MAKTLILYDLRQTPAVEAGRLEGREVVLGREAGLETIVINSTGVSRQHGLFTPIRNHWFYRDMGSTNGSWVNGQPCKKSKWYLIKPGDVVQLADTPLQISELASRSIVPDLGIRSLLVFARGDFQEEYPIPEYGRALVIGGAKADLKLDIDIYELPSLVVERRGEGVVAFPIAKETKAYCNDQELALPVILKDRDELRCGHYIVVYNDLPPDAAAAQMPAEDSRPATGIRESAGTKLFGTQEPGDEHGWEHSARHTAQKLPFGKGLAQDDLGVDETIALDPREMEKRLNYESHPAMRYSIQQDSNFTWSALEDKLILVLGLGLLLALMGLVLWWVLK
ncbi:MAG: hypothetical protein DCC75_05795 [Proteobacteria bacterium]|nr:MAG: hypothetical protein DCC75_05795 [Pseudomonadota bacterium]